MLETVRHIARERLLASGDADVVRDAHADHYIELFETVGTADRERFAPDLVKDRLMRVMDKLFFVWVVLGFAIPFALGWVIGGGIGTALTALLWGGFVRVLLLHHITWSINSVCHFFGRRRFDVEDESTNVFWLAPLSMGESWHHNHHAFPTSAFHGLRFWERMSDPATRAEIEEELYGFDDHIASNAIEVHIHNLRRKLGPRFITNLKGRGYRVEGTG